MFRLNIPNIIIGMDLFQNNQPISYCLTNEVILKINVLSPCIKHRVFLVKCALNVTMNDDSILLNP